MNKKRYWISKYTKCGNDFIHLIFLTLSHLKHISPTSRCVSRAIEIKDIHRTAPSTHSFRQTSVLKSASVLGKTIRGYRIIQKVSFPETSSSPVVGSQTGCRMEMADKGHWPSRCPTHTPWAHRAPCTVFHEFAKEFLTTHPELQPYLPLLFLLITHHPTDTF